MYLREVHAEKDITVLRQLIRDFPLGILTTAFPSTVGPFIQASHIPFLLDVEDETSPTELGKLRGHLARANPQSKALVEACKEKEASGASPSNVLTDEVLVLFNSPAQHYVTPKFYTETKPATGKVVPTWNYAAVQVYGKIRVYYDPASTETSDFLSCQVSNLSEYAESNIMGYTSPWKVTDSPGRYIELLKKAIIGIEIDIERLEGKFKMSQEMGAGDKKGVIDGFRNLGTETAGIVAKAVEERAGLDMKPE
ncbi:transcriptional regulator PAI 2-type [Stachybotrys elegans]|uniref:Transcriptional regulator PAI 2-type n=1 Tax=Stachybotrys elegans TaxID=80388 RepID=A0A8K0WTY3_9HYPO|nr:transcriptional regulator PAI 2-type [Stachybotrys elegans]